MRLLDRYLLRELLAWLGYCLGGFLIFWIAFDLFSQLSHFQDYHLQARDLVAYYVAKLPEFLVLVLPIALLLALLYTLTNHARHHELTAMRAAGISLTRICAPYFAVGLGCSLGLLGLNELWAPYSSEKAEDILERHTRQGAASADKTRQLNLGLRNARDRRSWMIGAYDFKLAEMANVMVDWRQPDGAWLKIVAARAARVGGVWVFENVQEYRAAATGTNETIGYMTLVCTTNQMAFPEFTETPEQFRREARFADQLSVRRARAAEMPIADLLDYLRLHPDVSPKNRWLLATQLQGRLAAPWTCLVVVLIAIPFGAASGRRNIFMGVAGSIGICFAYFILLRFGLALGTGGYLPAVVAAWLPNATFAVAGLWLTNRVR